MEHWTMESRTPLLPSPEQAGLSGAFLTRDHLLSVAAGFWGKKEILIFLESFLIYNPISCS
jgi:hypothetical protein